MELYQRPETKFWVADFAIKGKRFRMSTQQTRKSAAMEVAMEFYRREQRRRRPSQKQKIRTVAELAKERFLPFIEASTLDSDSKRYYQTGWRLLSESVARDWRLEEIDASEVDTLRFTGSGANANCALRTLRRMLSLACDWEIIDRKPRIRLRKEVERTAVFDADMEEQFLKVARQPLRDVFLISHDSGLRPDEVIRMRWENVLWKKNLIFVPNGKTEQAKRYVPLSQRVRDLLLERKAENLAERKASEKSEWVFPSSKKKESHISYFPIAKQFAKARKDADIPKGVVLYSARHSFATDMLDRTGNIVLVGRMLGHRSVTTTQRYLHPEMKGLAELVDERNEMRAGEAQRDGLRHSLRHSREAVVS
ncbi:MAG: tyrosine-type recombinase/integrase [Acidobacteriaceae bacterium]